MDETINVKPDIYKHNILKNTKNSSVKKTSMRHSRFVPEQKAEYCFFFKLRMYKMPKIGF